MPFGRVTVRSDEGTWTALGVGPLAILPAFRNQGIGSQLVWAGLQACRPAGQDTISVHGHPEFHPHFSFVPAMPLGIRWEIDAPEHASMVAELQQRGLAGRSGVVTYHPEFTRV